MKKALFLIASATIVFFGIALLDHSLAYAANCGNVFPTSLNNYVSGCTIPSAWGNALESKIGVTSSTATSSLDYEINHIFTSYGSEVIASSAIPWLSTSTSGGTTTINGLSGTVFNFTAAGTGLSIATSGTSTIGYTWTNPGYITGNQSITVTHTGDVTGSASGATSISVPNTVVKIQGVAVTSTAPTNGQVLQYNSTNSAWKPTTINTPSVATTTKTIYDPVASTTDQPAFVVAANPFTINRVICYQQVSGDTVTFNIVHGSTNVFSSGQTCTAVQASPSILTSFNSASVAAGETVYLTISAASSTASTVQIEY
jgi:hypothetical protein